MSEQCVNCGESIKSTDIFCPYCGNTKEGQPSSSGQSSSLQCASCGASNDFGVSFCQSCGQPIEAAKGTPPPPIDAPGQTQESYDYGSFSETSSTGERKWYTPPKRARSKKNPIEWFFWTCWGLYIAFRFLFQILWCVGMIAGRRR
ncbi:MAG: zinc ribbon domain-containing protein [Candidatus Heimdallarchaeota archaeon]